MEKIIQFAQIISAVLLVIVILMQNKGAGMGAAFGGDSSVQRSKRGAEKTLFTATIVLAVLFLGLSLVLVFIG